MTFPPITDPVFGENAKAFHVNYLPCLAHLVDEIIWRLYPHNYPQNHWISVYLTMTISDN